jgi:hypothetical protein
MPPEGCEGRLRGTGGVSKGLRVKRQVSLARAYPSTVYVEVNSIDNFDSHAGNLPKLLGIRDSGTTG